MQPKRGKFILENCQTEDCTAVLVSECLKDKKDYERGIVFYDIDPQQQVQKLIHRPSLAPTDYKKISEIAQTLPLEKRKPVIQSNGEYTRFFIQLPLSCCSNQKKLILESLIKSLQKSPYFPANVKLIDHKANNKIDPSLKWTEKDYFYQIAYSIQIWSTSQEQIDRQGQKFQMLSEGIHGVLQEYMRRFALQNQLGYWINKFQKKLGEVSIMWRTVEKEKSEMVNQTTNINN